MNRQQQMPSTSFFRKAGENSYFGGNQSSSFFTPPVQAKLSVSSPDDPQEKEADAVADQVMRMPEPVTSVTGKEEEKVQTKPSFPVIHRTAEETGKEELQAKAQPHIHRSTENQDIERARTGEGFAPSLVYRKPISLHRSAIIQRSGRAPPQEDSSFHEQLASKRGGGTVLPSGTQQFMETRFGADFSGVRVHTGGYASEMSSSIQAQAFTHGNDIYFNQGKYSPDTPSGGTLLAHELTHTIQQGASPTSSVSTKSIQCKGQQGLIQRSLLNEGFLSQIDLEGRSGGKPLSKEAKEYLEGYYHTNLDDIRLHSDYEIANVCRAAGVNAFVKGKDIAVVPWRINMDTEEGAVLLSEQVAKSLKQRNIRAVGSDGNDVGIVALLLNQIRKAVEENKLDQAKVDQEKRAPVTPLAPPAKDKRATEKKTVSDKGKKGAARKLKGKGRKRSADGPSFKPAKTKKGRSPSKPSEDPAFLRVVSTTKKTAKGQKDHEPAEKKSEEAQKSAVAVPKEAEGKAQNRKTDGMGTATTEDKPFDAAAFKKELLKKIEEITPKNLEEANDFKKDNKIDKVKTTVNEKVEGGKKETTGPVDKATAEPLQVNPADNKQPVPLPPTPAGPKPGEPGAANAVPKNKTGEEISMQEQSSSLEEEMKKNNVTENQLTTSNEPSFAEALNEKQAAQKDAVDKPKQYKKEEAVELKAAKAEATQDATKTLTVMHGARGKNFADSVQQQQTSKKKDEDARTKVTNEIERLYGLAEVAVKKALEEADTQSNSLFDKGSQEAQQEFEDYVDRRMRAYKADRYSGFWGGLRWAKDKIVGMPDAVNVFYTEGRQRYLNKMDRVITEVADVVTTKLNETKKAIKDGKKAIDDYVTQLPKDLQSVGKEAADSIQDKFDSLEQSVNDKRDGLIDGLAKKYVDNVKKLDERIEELKEANQGLIDKAIGFLKKVWKVIKDLYNLFTTILAKLAAIIGVIMDNPGGFFENVGKAFRKGFDQFKAKFMDYLEKGLMEWLATNLGIAGLELPKEFSPGAILSLSLQVMGITKQHIKERAIGILGERKVKRLEQAGGLLFKIYNEGLGALWDLIIEKISDFKEIIWEAIKSYIKTAIIEAAIVFILSLLNPIGAFIKVCMAIYDFLIMLVRFKDRIIELLDTILAAVTDIASGAVDAAATAIEKAFAKSIPIIIAFLAALLRLNDIAVKVRNIITRIRARVDKAIDYAINKAWSFIGKGVDSVLGLEDKGMAMVEKGKEKVIDAGKNVIGKFRKWLGLEKKFVTPNGENHRLYFGGTEGEPILMVQSDPEAFSKFLKGISTDTKEKAEAKKDAITIAKAIDDRKKAPLEGKTEEEKEKSKEEKLKEVELLLDVLAIHAKLLFGDVSLAGEPKVVNGTQGSGYGITMKAVKLNKVQKRKGTPPTSSSHSSYAVLNKRRQEGNPSASYYVKGHLLNEGLGGLGQWENLTPLSRVGNSDHEGKIESRVKAAFDSGAIVEYNVTAIYGYGQNESQIPATDQKAVEKKQIIKEEVNVPLSLNCEAFLMEKKDNDYVRKEKIISNNVPNPIGQSASSYTLSDSAPRDDIYLNTREKDKIATIEGLDNDMADKIILAHEKNSALNRKSRFNTYLELSDARKDMAFHRVFKTATEQKKILDLSGLKYVKLYNK